MEEKKTLSDKISMTIGLCVMWPMMFDSPTSEIAKEADEKGVWHVIWRTAKEIWK